jgi:Transposase IS116/IS110/IS902 family
MTLAGCGRKDGVRIIVWCKACQHESEPDPAEMAARYGVATLLCLRLLDRLPLPSPGGPPASAPATGTEQRCSRWNSGVTARERCSLAEATFGKAAVQSERHWIEPLAATTRHSDIGRRLMTVPGVGPLTSLGYIATVDDPGRFDSSKAPRAHLGLTPRVYQSGEIDRSGQISKCGDRMLRHLPYEAASALMIRTRRWSRLRAWGVSVAKRRGMKRATVAVARKLAVIMHRIWVTGDEFDFGGPAVAAKAA